MPFTLIGLSDPLVRGILATGYTAPTEIQLKAIPAAIAGRDIIGCAQTGTGKTAAFVLPILNRLSHERFGGKRVVKALILTPTRELAVQVEQCIRDYGQFLKLRTLAVYGGISIGNQLNSLLHGVDIVVATPGRLMDHMQRGSIKFKDLEVLVLDEADRMLDMGFVRDVRKIVRALPHKRQTLLFSATISREVKVLAKEIQQNPVMIQIGRERNPIETITQHLYAVNKDAKMELLLHMLKTTHMYSVLVFSRTKYGADKISRKLAKANIPAVAIHSNRTQNQRQRALDGFKGGKYQVMVATDIASRGIDVDGITHVVNYDVPCYAEDYLHRIGRTGRATALGDAITFVSPDEMKKLRRIEKFISRKLQPKNYPGFTASVRTPAKAAPSKRTSKPAHKSAAPKPKAKPARKPKKYKARPGSKSTKPWNKSRRTKQKPTSKPKSRTKRKS